MIKDNSFFDFTIVSVDFDGTLCYGKFPDFGEPNKKLICRLIDIRKAGHRIILNTCRGGKLLEEAIKWCKEKGLEFDAVNDNIPEVKKAFVSLSNKVFAHFYLDDRNVVIEDII